MTGAITGIELDGVLYDISEGGTLVARSGPVPDPTPDPQQQPDTVRIGSATYPLTGINPTPASNPQGAAYPGARGEDQLVAYRRPDVEVTVTNRWGREVCVTADGVAASSVTVTGTLVPPYPGYVLSGHGKAGTWLERYAIPGAVVELVTLDTDPDPTPTPSDSVRTLSVYLKMWANSKLPGLAAAAVPGITEVRLAFLQGSPPRLVGWGSQTEAEVVADCQTLRARGVAITASIGGSGGHIDTGARGAFVQGVDDVHATIGLDRIDWDVEASALDPDDVLGISQTLHDSWGTCVTMAPNGSNVATYLPVAVELHQRGLLVAYGQQFYDAAVPLGTPDPSKTGTAMGRIAQAITAGLPPETIQVGMMVGSDSKYWSMDECETHMAAIVAEWPCIGGAYLWSEKHTEVTEWARRVGAVLGLDV